MTRPPGPESQLPYSLWIEDAMRGIVRHALADVAESGLPGNHHFFITFRTDAPGVVIPADQRARYPSEMTIVLQHKFADLVVEDEAFEVVLSFSGRRTPLRVPFAAIATFADPSVNFALQFNANPTDDAATSTETGPAEAGNTASDSGASAPTPQDETSDTTGTTESVDAADKVVTLDAFRKKS